MIIQIVYCGLYTMYLNPIVKKHARSWNYRMKDWVYNFILNTKQHANNGEIITKYSETGIPFIPHR